MSTAFDLWWASRRRDEPVGLPDAFAAGEKMAAARYRRVEVLAQIAGGVAASLLFNGPHRAISAKKAADVAEVILAELEARS